MKIILKWFLLSLAFVPLLVNFDTLFPFIFTKTLLIRSAITLFWAVLAVWYFLDKKSVRELIKNNQRFYKNPLYVFTAIFMFLMLFSTVFAVDSYKAFFGDIERGEGYLGILHFFSFFVASLLVFEKRDWITFFRLSLVTGAILLVDSIGEVVGGEFARAQSFTGNPTFLAGYFLFVILSALIVFPSSRDSVSWKIFSFLMIFGGFVGVFLTQTRGAILGLVVGAALATLYFAIKGRGVVMRLPGGFKTDLQKLGIGLLILGILGVGTFTFTRSNEFWQGVPGLNRFVVISLDDATLQTRLISAGVSIDSVKPGENGLHRFFIGYGPDNFNIAYNKHFNPEYMRYENLWFDRAHNKIFDVLVMNGSLGLIAYLGMWASLFYLAFRRIREKEYAVPLIFFGSAYFVQNIFVFDQISTWIPFFAFLAFAVFAGSEPPGEQADGRWALKSGALFYKFLPYKLSAVALFFSFSLVAYAYVPYFQSISFVKALQTRNAQAVLDSVESFTQPYTYAQATIRNRLLSLVMPLVGNPEATELISVAVALEEEFFAREPYDPRDASLIGNIYRLKGSIGEPGAYDKAVKYQSIALSLSPTRQDHLYSLASIAADRADFATMQEHAGRLLETSPTVARTQILYGTVISREGSNRYTEAVEVLNSALNDPKLYFSGEQEITILRSVYELYVGHFYRSRDEKNFLSALTGARDLELRVEERSRARFEAGVLPSLPPERSGEFERNIQLFNEGGWSAIVIEG